MSVNKVILIGRLGQDPELRHVNNNAAVCTFSMATGENWVDKDGKKQEKTEWHKIVVWNKQAENCAKYLGKGRQVYLEGKLQTRSWEDQEGQKKYTTEIVATTVQFLGSKDEAGQTQYTSNTSQASAPTNKTNFQSNPSQESSNSPAGFVPDDIPF